VLLLADDLVEGVRDRVAVSRRDSLVSVDLVEDLEALTTGAI
jgi:hypothetical protein